MIRDITDDIATSESICMIVLTLVEINMVYTGTGLTANAS